MNTDVVAEHGCSFLVQPFADDGSRNDRDHCRTCGKPRRGLAADLAEAAAIGARLAGLLTSGEREVLARLGAAAGVTSGG